ncbi:Cell division control protein 12 [Brettanomyces nanus]|uniref:Cell division control protein 12 n=1 Tax=Eeniella nana TaxID=13502 RepID=A0A875S7S8_EENNA|nr:Cell division control protein 12 [Brettanomyces nanus]QPG76325.1 Cell division control protein 12 [Brettanomyces nanus]
MSQPATINAEPIGITNLPNQRYKIVSKEGAAFTIMLAGESGLGKTTFINTLFQTVLAPHQDNRNRFNKPVKKTVEINIVRAELEEKNFKLRLNIIDTPGFGDNVNNKNAWQPIVEFIDAQHESYMKQESQPQRSLIKDLRVHACLYFIRPTGHTLKPLDIEAMKKIGTRANLIPVIAKADTLTPNEMLEFKKRIRAIIEAQNIRIYSPPIEADDQAAAEHAKQLIESMPFAVIGSEEDFEVDGKMVKGRRYPWGFVEVENDQHCDFRKLRSLLLRTNMLDLIVSTQEIHFETYRRLKMNGEVNTDDSKDTSSKRKSAERFIDNPEFVEEEKRLKRYFAEQLRNEDQRFKQWKQNIHTEKNRLNHDLANLQSDMKKLEEEVKVLKQAKAHN